MFDKILMTCGREWTGPVLKQTTNTIPTAKSCSRIIYDAGYLLTKDDSSANCNADCVKLRRYSSFHI